MSRLRLHLGKGAAPPPPPSGLTMVVQPQVSGIPRAGKSYSIYGGEWSSTPTNLRYTIYRDGSLIGTVNQATGDTGFGEYNSTFADADAGTIATMFVAASGDNGGSYTTPVECYYSFYPDTQLIEPAIPAPDLVATRTSSAGVTPVTFSIAGTIYPSFEWEVVKLNSDFLTETYRGRKPVTEYEIANLVLDLDGATGPALDPVMSALGATEILKFRLVTQDWSENPINPGDNVGLAGRWVAVSATDFGGNQFYKLTTTRTPQGVGGAVVMVAVELAESVGGPNLLRGGEVNVFYSAGDESPSPPGGATFQSDHIFDGSPSTYGALTSTPVDLTFDMLVPRPMNRLRITSTVNNFQQAPGDFTFGPCLANGTYIGSPGVNLTGISWSASADQTQQWSF